MIEQFFFSKRNISLLNRVVLNTLQYQNKSKVQKKLYVQILLGNMKKVYKSIDSGKINDSNINNILEQFNQWSIQQTVKEIKIKQKENIENPQISQLRLQREKSMQGNRDLRYIERPSHTSSSMFKNTNTPTHDRDNFSSRNLNNMLQSNENIKLLDENKRFNNYDFNSKGSDQTEKDLERLMMARETDIPTRTNRNKEINFTLDEGKKKEKFSNMLPNNQNNNKNNIKQGGVMEFNSSDRDYSSNMVMEHDLTDNLNSLNNYDTLIIDDNNANEDSAPFESRLKQLQSERSNLEGNVSYEMPNQTNTKQQPMQQQPMQQQPMQQQPMQQQPMQQQPMQQQPMQEQPMQEQPMQEQPMQEQPMQEQYIHEQYPQTIQHQQQNYQTNINSEYNNVPQNNNESNINLGGYFDMIQKLNSEIMGLKEANFKLLQQRPNMDEFTSIDDAKKEIAGEFNKLTEKHNLVERNMQILMQKEMHILKKEEEINQIIQNYNNVLNVSTYQVTIDSRFMDSHAESYRFDLEGTINRVTHVELIAYNVPITKYNINKYNNIIKYKLEEDDDEKTIELDCGAYDIELLLKLLNDKCDKLTFSTDFRETIEIKHEDDKTFNLVKSSLLYKVLGFKKQDYESKKSYKSERVYELRNDNYVNLHISNIVSEKEFCTLNLMSGQTVKKIELVEPKTLEHFDISFTSYENKPISFNDRYHTLTFKIIALNEPLETSTNVIEYTQEDN
jgi:hypothetical protein